MLFDTHVNLIDPRFDEDRAAVLERARAAGLCGVVEIADAPADWEKCLALAAANPGFVYCSLGLHPYHADEWRPELAAALLAAAGQARRAGALQDRRAVFVEAGVYEMDVGVEEHAAIIPKRGRPPAREGGL